MAPIQSVAIEELHRELEAVRAEIVALGPPLGGTIVTQKTQCKGPQCGCNATPPRSHEAHYWRLKRGGRTRSTPVPPEYLAACRQMHRDAQQLRLLTERALDIGSRIAALILSADPPQPVEAINPPATLDGSWSCLLQLAEAGYRFGTLGQSSPNALFSIDGNCIGIQRLRGRGDAEPGRATLERSEFALRWRIIARDGYLDRRNVGRFTLSAVWAMMAALPWVEYASAFDLRLRSEATHPLGTTRRVGAPETPPSSPGSSLPFVPEDADAASSNRARPAERLDRDDRRALVMEMLEAYDQPEPTMTWEEPDLSSWEIESRARQLLEADPNAFLLYALFTRNYDWTRACQAPFLLLRRLGHERVPIERLADMETAELEFVIRTDGSGGPTLHRFPGEMARAVVSACRRLRNEYGGRASNIWSGEEPLPAREVGARIRAFYGAGRKVEHMVLRHLALYYGVPLQDLQNIDIAADRHVARVFLRAGLIDPPTEGQTRFRLNSLVDSVVRSARALRPSFPAELDEPAWFLGLHTCTNREARCGECVAREICPRTRRHWRLT